MNIVGIIGLIFFGVLIFILGLALSAQAARAVKAVIQKRKEASSSLAANAQKEKKILAELLADIKANTSDWCYSDILFSHPFLANNKTNMGIELLSRDNLAQPAERCNKLRIFLNLTSSEEFNRKDPNTLYIEIEGEHTSNFIEQSLALLNQRGKELSFFENKLKERL